VGASPVRGRVLGGRERRNGGKEDEAELQIHRVPRLEHGNGGNPPPAGQGGRLFGWSPKNLAPLTGH
jgi:hypothetical protein